MTTARLVRRPLPWQRSGGWGQTYANAQQATQWLRTGDVGGSGGRPPGGAGGAAVGVLSNATSLLRIVQGAITQQQGLDQRREALELQGAAQRYALGAQLSRSDATRLLGIVRAQLAVEQDARQVEEMRQLIEELQRQIDERGADQASGASPVEYAVIGAAVVGVVVAVYLYARERSR